MRFFQGADYHFIERRKTAYVFSASAILVGIAAMVFNVVSIGSWQRYGVDFTGGSLVQVRFNDNSVTAGQVRQALGNTQTPITKFGENAEFVIRAPVEEGMSIDSVAAGLERQIAAGFGEGSFTVGRTELVGAKVGGELQQKALLAMSRSELW